MENVKIKIDQLLIKISSLNNGMCGPCRFRDYGGSGPGNYCVLFDSALRGKQIVNERLNETMEDFRNTYRADQCLANQI